MRRRKCSSDVWSSVESMPAASNGRGVTARCAASHNLILSALVLAYVVLGAFLFQSLEAGHELRQRAAVRNFRDDCLRELWLITGTKQSYINS